MTASCSYATTVDTSAKYFAAKATLAALDFDQPAQQIVNDVFSRAFTLLNRAHKNLHRTVHKVLQYKGNEIHTKAAAIAAVLLANTTLNEHHICDPQLDQACDKLAQRVLDALQTPQENASEDFITAKHAAVDWQNRDMRVIIEHYVAPPTSTISPYYRCSSYRWLAKARQHTNRLVQKTLKAFEGATHKIHDQKLKVIVAPKLAKHWSKLLAGEWISTARDRYVAHAMAPPPVSLLPSPSTSTQSLLPVYEHLPNIDLGNICSEMGLVVEGRASRDNQIVRAKLLLHAPDQHSFRDGGLACSVTLEQSLCAPIIWMAGERQSKWITSIPLHTHANPSSLKIAKSPVWPVRFCGEPNKHLGRSNVRICDTFSNLICDDQPQWTSAPSSCLRSLGEYRNWIVLEALHTVDLLCDLHSQGFAYNALNPESVGRSRLPDARDSSAEYILDWVHLNHIMDIAQWQQLITLLQDVKQTLLTLTPHHSNSSYYTANLQLHAMRQSAIHALQEQARTWMRILDKDYIDRSSPLDIVHDLLEALPVWPVSPYTAPEIAHYLHAVEGCTQQLQQEQQWDAFLQLQLPESLEQADVWSLGKLLYEQYTLTLGHDERPAESIEIEYSKPTRLLVPDALLDSCVDKIYLSKLVEDMLVDDPALRPSMASIQAWLSNFYTIIAEKGLLEEPARSNGWLASVGKIFTGLTSL